MQSNTGIKSDYDNESSIIDYDEFEAQIEEPPAIKQTSAKNENLQRIRILNPISKTVNSPHEGTIIQNLVIESASCDSMIEDYIEDSNYDEQIADNHHIIHEQQSNIPTKIEKSQNPFMIKRRKVVEVPRIEHSYSIPKAECVVSTPKSVEPKDGCEIFGAHVAFKLQSYNPYVRNMAQHLINNVLFDEDMGKFDSFSNVHDDRSQ